MTLPPRNQGVRLSGATLHRAAAALVIFCEHHRHRLRAFIDGLEATATLDTGVRAGSKASRKDVDASVNDDDSYSSGGARSKGQGVF